MNRGDAGHLLLNIKVNGAKMPKDYANEIEITFSATSCTIRKTMSAQEVTWSEPDEMYQVFLSQQDTMKMNSGNNQWQIRLLRGSNVISSRLGTIIFGEGISDNILTMGG